MIKIFLLLTCFAVIHWTFSADTKHKSDEKISFVDAPDETDTVREKIRTEMENYKRIKEMMFKKKLLNSPTMKPIDIETSSAATFETTKFTEVTVAAEATKAAVEVSTEASVLTSSTVRAIQLFLGNPDEDEDFEEGSTMTTVADEDFEEGSAVMMTDKNFNQTEIDDRFILTAPLACKPGRKAVDGVCRKIA